MVRYSFLISVVAFFYFFSTCYSPKLYDDTCNSNHSCSYQIPGISENQCRVFHLDSSSLETDSDCLADYFIANEQNSKFSPGKKMVNVFPNYFRMEHPNGSVGVALNLSFEIFQESEGVLIWIKLKEYKTCQGMLLDKLAISYPLTLWYDCLYFEDHVTATNVSFSIVNLSTGIKRIFYSKLPSIASFSDESNYNLWEFPIFIEMTEDQIIVFFQEIPDHFDYGALNFSGNFNYHVMLSINDSIIQECYIMKNSTNTTQQGLHSVIFHHPESTGHYNVAVATHNVTTPTELYKINALSLFLRVEENKSYSTVIMVLFGILGIAIILTLIVLFKCFCLSKPKPTEELEVLVLYSYDNKYHLTLVEDFVHLLRSKHFRIYFDKEERLWDPYDWLKDHIFKDNIRIILIWSSGAIHKAQQNSSLFLLDEPCNLTSHLFGMALKLVQSVKKCSSVISIVWDGTKRSDVIKLMPETSCYILPEEWSSFTNHLCFPGQTVRNCSSCFTTVHLFRKNLKTHPEGRAFLKAHDVMCLEGDYFSAIHKNKAKEFESVCSDSDVSLNKKNTNKSNEGHGLKTKIIGNNFFNLDQSGKKLDSELDKSARQNMLTANKGANENSSNEECVLLHPKPNSSIQDHHRSSSSSSYSDRSEQEEGWLRNYLAT